ncbi:MAG: hypothetical protein HQRvContig05_31 [Haloquadratum phage sp.]|nr:MAG: hypothetical protein HQRvContig05_31 [Haloquadratum phage sp.]
MPVDTNTEVNSIDGRGSADASLTDGFEDLSAGTTADLSTGDGAASTATLFIATEGAVDLTIEFRPTVRRSASRPTNPRLSSPERPKMWRSSTTTRPPFALRRRTRPALIWISG